MNKVELTGRQVREAQLTYTAGDNPTAVFRNSIAVNRRGVDKGADFIGIVAFGKTAEFMDKYGHKGIKWEIIGRIQTGSYEKDGTKVFTTDVVVEEVTFAESKGAAEAEPTATVATKGADEFMQIPDGIDEELPFV